MLRKSAARPGAGTRILIGNPASPVHRLASDGNSLQDSLQPGESPERDQWGKFSHPYLHKISIVAFSSELVIGWRVLGW